MASLTAGLSASFSDLRTTGFARGATAGGRRVVLPVLLAGAVLFAWHLLADAKIFPPSVLPAPGTVWSLFIGERELLMEHAEKTFVECFEGFLLAAVVGIGIATLISVSRTARRILYPNLVLFQLIPTIALAPLFILWFGIGPESRLAYALFIALFSIVVSASTGLLGTSPYYVRLCESLTANRWQILFRVRFPFALPHIFTGLRIGLTLAIIGVVVGEFITAQSGIGYIISFASSAMETALALAAILYLLGVGLVLFILLTVVEIVLKLRYGVGR